MTQVKFNATYNIWDTVYLKTDKEKEYPFMVIGYLIDDNETLYYHLRNSYLNEFFSEQEINNILNN